jgi:hypothetical protein
VSRRRAARVLFWGPVLAIAGSVMAIISVAAGGWVSRWEIITWSAIVIVWAALVLALQRQVRDQKELLEIQRLMLKGSLRDPWRPL